MRTDGAMAGIGRLQSGMCPTSGAGAGGTKGFQERVPAAGQAASLPATLRIGPRDSVAPGDRPRRSRGAQAAVRWAEPR